MKRTIAAATAALGLTLATFALAPSAQAITNPADNPSPITVKGDDGKTYHDGEDTLPGYDDELCTYIPGAYFDFDKNRVRYADGQSIPWTEWERATGYDEWKADQDKGDAPSTPKPTKAPTKSSGSGSGTGTGAGSGSTKGSGSSAGTGTGAAASGTPTAGAATTVDPKTGATVAVPGPSDGSTSDAQGDVDQVTLATVSSDSPSSDQGSGGGSAGLLILGGLAGAGLLTFAGYSVIGRKRAAAAKATP